MNNNQLQQSLTFDDVLMVPKFSPIRSRKNCDISSYLGGFKLTLPIISSPMDTITEGEMAYRMSQNGGLGVIHRRCTIEQQVQMVLRTKFMSDTGPSGRHIIGAAIGTVGDFLERAKELLENGTDVLCVDVAHRPPYISQRSII